MSDPAQKLKTPRAQGRRETLVRLAFLGFCGVVMVSYFVFSIFETPLEADNFTNGFSTSPGGHSALIELLRKNKREVKAGHSKLRLPDFDYGNTDTLALLQPGPQYVEEFEDEFKSLFNGARETETSLLLVMPKRTYQKANEQPEGGDLVLWEDFHSLHEVRTILEYTGFNRWMDIDRVAGENHILAWSDGTAQTAVSGPTQVFRLAANAGEENFDILATDESNRPVVVRYRVERYSASGGVLLVSDPDIFTNRYISNNGAATLAMRVFDETPDAGVILVDEDLHGFSTDASLEYLAATPPGLWVTLSVLLLLGVFGWREATVLRPREAEPQDRRERKFSIEGLARMMERAGDHHKAYKRLVWRSRLVLGSGGAQVQGAGKGGTQAIKKGHTGRITRIQGETSEEKLINVAAKVAHQKRTGESAGEWE